MSQYTVDHVGRMRQIKAALDQSGEAADAVQQKENMLEELLDIVDNIDYARGDIRLCMMQLSLIYATNPVSFSCSYIYTYVYAACSMQQKVAKAALTSAGQRLKGSCMIRNFWSSCPVWSNN